MKRIVWLGMLSVMAGLAPAVEKPAAQDNETAVVPKPGTKAFYEQRIVGRCALDGESLVPVSTTKPASSTGRRPLPPQLTRLGGVRNHAKWIEGHAIQSLGTNRVVIGQAETNASGAVFHRPSCVVDLLPETPVSEVGTDIRVLAVPDGSVSCETADGNITSRRTLQVYREVWQPTFEEYKAIYERESRPVPLEPIVSLERETRLPAVGAIPVRRKPTVVSDTPTTPVSDAPFAVLTTNGTVRIVKYSGTDAKVVIPERINGLPVVAIQAGAFDGCHGMTEVTIPATVTSIHDHAFHGCPALTSILVDVMNPVYSSSADGVLFNMEKTRLVRFPMGKQGEYTVPQRTTEIGSHAFEECGLTEITLPERLEEIGCRAFWGCSSLKTILFKGDAPPGTADRSVFQGCAKVTVYRRPDAKGWGETFGGRPVKVWEESDTPPQPVVTQPDVMPPTTAHADRTSQTKAPATVAPQDHFSFETNNNTITITKYKGPGGDVVVPNEINGLPVTCFKKSAFWNLTHFNSITIPASVTHVGDKEKGFHWTIDRTPDGTHREDASVFAMCSALTNSTVEAGNIAYASIDGVLFDHARTTLIRCPPGRAGSYSIPSGVTSIDSFGFSCCSGLTNLTISSSVTTIRDWALSFCFGIQNVVIPASVNRISGTAFNKCFGLTNILVEVGSSAFTSVDGVLFDKTATRLILYPKGRKGHYSIPSGTTSIDQAAFNNCIGLTSMEIPTSVTRVGASSWSGCSALTNIMVHTESSTFSSVDGVLFNKSATSMLRYPTGRKGHYDIPVGVTSIGDDAFSGCSELSGVTIPDSVTQIGRGAFWGCDTLTHVKIPASVVKIGDSAFTANSDCPKILSFEGDAPEIGNNAFGFNSIFSTIYYRTGTRGWVKTFGGLPTKEWNGTEECDPFMTPRSGDTANRVQLSGGGHEPGILEVSKLICNPSSPGILGHGDSLTCAIMYEVDRDGEYVVSVSPVFEGKRVRVNGERSAYGIRRGKGWETLLWRITNDTRIDQLQIVFYKRDSAAGNRPYDKEMVVKEMYVDVDYEFRDKYADVKPNPLYDGIQISANMSLPNAARLRDAFSKDGAKRVDSHDCGASARATLIGADVGIKTVQRALELCRQHMPDAKRFYIFSEDRYRRDIYFGSGNSPKIPDMSPDLFSKLLAADLTLEEFHRLVNDHNATATSVASPPAPVRRRRPSAPARPAATLKVGDPAPPLAQGKYVQGEPVAAFEKGKVYVVEFWATWCGPCRTVIPHVNALQEKHKDKGLVVIGQNVWQRGENVEGDVAEFVKQMGSNMTYRVALDRDDAMSGIWMKAAGRGGIPSAFVVNREGKIAWIGYPGSGLDEAVGTLLGNIGQGARP